MRYWVPPLCLIVVFFGGSTLSQSIDGNWNVVHPKKTSSEIIDSLKEHRIIPEIVQRVATDIQVCEVSYNNTVINFGNVINYTFIQEHEPTHIKWPFKKDVLYTLILSSPDAPGREEHNERELKMWLVGNIPENDIKNGTPIADYVGMVPFYEEGHHRYIYFVYEQEDAGHIDFKDEVHIQSNVVSFKRAYHNTELFRERYNLGPIAAINFFNVYYERKSVVSLMRAYHHTEEFRDTYRLGQIVATNFFLMNFERRMF